MLMQEKMGEVSFFCSVLAMFSVFFIFSLFVAFFFFVIEGVRKRNNHVKTRKQMKGAGGYGLRGLDISVGMCICLFFLFLKTGLVHTLFSKI